MNSQGKEEKFISSWQVAKILWIAQALSSLSFGVPIVIMVLFAANINFSAVSQTALLYLAVSFTVFVPLNGILSLIFLGPVKKRLNKAPKGGNSLTKQELWATGELLNLPLKVSFISFVLSFLGFAFGLLLLWLGLIPGLLPLIKTIITLGFSVGFVVCLVQSSLIYVLLESYFRPKIEALGCSYSEIIKAGKVRKFSIFWKVLLLSLSAVVVSQVSLWALYLGRIIIYSPQDIKNGLIYIGVVAVLTLFYVTLIAFSASRNLVYPIRKIIFWADKIIKKEARKDFCLVTNDETTDLIEYLKEMHEELENAKASLEIRIKARTKELEDLTERQEETIKERVREIKERAEELERFQKLAVGRELKMIELKKEIRKLKETVEQRSRGYSRKNKSKKSTPKIRLKKIKENG